MAKGIVVIKHANKDIPEEYLKRIVDSKPNCMGLVFLNKTDGLLNVTQWSRTIDVEALQEIQKAFSNEVVFHFGDYPAQFSKEDVQPLVLLTDGKDNPIVTAILEGDFSHFTKKNSAHLDVYHVAMEYLAPKIDMINGLVDGDITKLVNSLKSTSVTKDMENLIISQGSVTLTASNGESWSYTKDRPIFKFDWGATSNTLGFEKVGTKKPSLLDSVMRKATTTSAPIMARSEIPPELKPPAKPERTTPDQPLPVEPDKLPGWDPAGYPPEEKGGPKRFKPSVDLTHAKDKVIIKAYKRILKGAYPKNFRELPEVIAKDEQDRYKLTQMAKGAPAPKPAEQVQPQQSLKDKIAEKAHKVVEPAHIKPAASGSTVREAVPILSKEEKEDVMKQFLASLYDENGKRLPFDPKKTTALEGKYPTFSQIFGLGGVSQTYNWSFDDLLKLAEDHPRAAAILIRELVINSIKLAEQIPPSVKTNLKDSIAAKAAARA